jgi:acyl-CoA dehydrogenase
MDFALNEEHLAFKEETHKFAEKEMRPKAREYDEKNEFPFEIMQKAFAAGFLTSGIPSECNGAGFSALINAIVCEELAWGCTGMYTSIMANTLATTPLVLFASDEQKKKFLVPLTQKMSFACFALTEKEAGSDNSAIQTTAVRRGDHYVINGSKTFITNAGVSQLGVVFASTDKSRGAVSRRSSCPWISLAFPSVSTKTRWGTGLPILQKSFSMKSRFRLKTS